MTAPQTHWLSLSSSAPQFWAVEAHDRLAAEQWNIGWMRTRSDEQPGAQQPGILTSARIPSSRVGGRPLLLTLRSFAFIDR